MGGVPWKFWEDVVLVVCLKHGYDEIEDISEVLDKIFKNNRGPGAVRTRLHYLRHPYLKNTPKPVPNRLEELKNIGLSVPKAPEEVGKNNEGLEEEVKRLRRENRTLKNEMQARAENMERRLRRLEAVKVPEEEEEAVLPGEGPIDKLFPVKNAHRFTKEGGVSK